MNEPMRLRDGDGAARRLMAGAVMHVPRASRRRAVAFTGTAATLGASATAVAASATSVVKSFVLCVALGAVGGGAVSLAASETVARLDTQPVSQAQPATAAPRPVPRTPHSVAVEAPAAALEAPLVDAPTVVEPAANAGGKAKAAGTNALPRVEPRVETPLRAESSLFEEQRIIESARAAVARGDFRSAFALLDGYEHTYTAKQFWPEALALRVEALRGSGQLGAARALATDFAQKYPHHPLLQRVEGIAK